MLSGSGRPDAGRTQLTGGSQMSADPLPTGLNPCDGSHAAVGAGTAEIAVLVIGGRVKATRKGAELSY